MATSAKKRQYTEAELSQDHPHSPPSKRFKPPPAFWDNLSKIPLTSSALKELSRRYTEQSCSQPEVKEPRTRSLFPEFKQRSQPIIPVSKHLLKAPQVDNTQLKYFARQGGPDLTKLRGYSEHTMSSLRSGSKRRGSTDPSSATSKKAKSTSPYNRGFEQHLIDHGIYLENRARAPENFKEIKERLAVPRSSLSPSRFSEAAFEAFQASSMRAKDEDDVLRAIFPVISSTDQDNHFSARNTNFGNLDPLTDGSIVPANPDLYYGARPEQLDRRIRDKLSGHIIPSTMQDKPMAPNFYLETKGPDGSSAVAKRQACYNGAIGARALQSLQSYGQSEPIYENSANTITATYTDGTLRMFTSHITPSVGPTRRPEYQMAVLGAWALDGSPEQFRQGTAAFRNGRDLAKVWRDEFISAANERADFLNAEPPILESTDFRRLSDTTDTRLTEESEALAHESASSASTHPVEEPDTVHTSFSHRGGDDILAGELDHGSDMIASPKRTGMGSEKTGSKDPGSGGGTSSRRGQSKK